MNNIINPQLYPFQQYGVNFLAQKTRALLADEMGLGKTIEVLKALVEINARRVLIICPNSVKYVWEKEVKKWHIPRTVQVVTGSKKMRLEQFKNPADIVVVNYALARIHEKILTHHWDVVVLDEAHIVKNRKALTTKAIRHITKNSEYIWELTGTPIINHASELFSLLQILDRKRYKSYWRFVGQHCIVFNNGFGWTVEDIIDATDSRVATLRDELKQYLLRRTREEVVPQMPAKTIEHIFVDLSPEHRKIYEQMKHDMFAKLDPNTSIFVPTVAVQLMRLRQIAIDPTLMLNSIDKPLSGAKIDAVKTILTSTNDSVVIFSNFSRVVKRMQLNLNSWRISSVLFTGDTSQTNRVRAIEQFQRKEVRVFLATLGSGGQGINLETSATAIFVDKAWSPAYNKQAQDRIYRLSQTRPVIIYEIFARDTIEEKIEKLLKRKHKIQLTLLEQFPVSLLI